MGEEQQVTCALSGGGGKGKKQNEMSNVILSLKFKNYLHKAKI